MVKQGLQEGGSRDRENGKGGGLESWQKQHERNGSATGFQEKEHSQLSFGTVRNDAL